jgi:hypothetical protein
MITSERLKTAIWETDRHTKALIHALQDWDKINTPTRIEEIEHNPELMRLTDQILFRFIKLQDAIGLRLLPATLAALQEPYEELSMQDRLNRLEKLDILNVDSWLRWREIRNRLTHEYPDQNNLRLSNLYAAITAAKEIINDYLHWRTKLEQHQLVNDAFLTNEYIQ